MNRVDLIGRLTADTELKTHSNNTVYTRFTLAVNRNYKNDEGKRDADFISCVAWRKTAELINQHFKKGSEIGLSGRIQTGSYERADGTKAYTTDVVVDEITFLGSKKESRHEPEYTGQQTTNSGTQYDPFEDIENEVIITDDDLPF
jgi:single-strand DNA-binding protein